MTVIDFNDPDGDGVETVQEERDGTNPNDPCMYNAENQIFHRTSEEWRNLDCDGDGVSNGKELDPDGDGTLGPNHTNPKSICDFNINDLIYSNTSPIWRNTDCDGDGVINKNEIDPDGNNMNDNNGTDPFDWCDLILSKQTIPPDPYWYEFDCDEDCQNNGEELDFGTDPLDDSDYFGKGDYLMEIWFGDPDQPPFRKQLFDQQGNRFIKTLDQNGQILANYEYDTENNLILAEINYSGTIITTIFEYSNGMISSFTVNNDGYITNTNVVYDSNTILTFDGTEPPGQFKSKITFDPIHQKAILFETFWESGGWKYARSTYSYDPSFENLLSIYSYIQGYDATTGEFYDLYFDNWVNREFKYESPGTLNPTLPAMEKIYINFLLQRNILQWNWQIDYAGTSRSFLTRFDYSSESIGSTIQYGVNCEQDNHLPYSAYYAVLGGQYDIDILYE